MSHNHETYLSKQHFDSLDGLRAISIAMVIWHHTAPQTVSRGLLHLGSEGVTLFFAISGFLITTLLVREQDRYTRISLKAFFIRRSLRIVPLYFAVLTGYIALVSLIEPNSVAGQAFFRNLIFFATYTSNLFVTLDSRTIFYFSWSLATEEQFYLVWPLILVFTRERRLAKVILFVLLALCILLQFLGNNSLSKIPISLIGGALLALTLHGASGFRLVSATLRPWGMQLGIILTLVSTLLISPNNSTWVHLLCLALVAQCVVQENNIAARLLTWKPAVYVGSISYGMYLLHMLCKHLALKLLGVIGISATSFLLFPTTFFVAALAGTLSFRYFESFFLRYKSRFQR
jgi:peptidoglycan/LPS O-acetylase OafA/YrhL